MECMFSGEVTSNEEHVIPRWMQKRYKLVNQNYHLPNGTIIKYKYAKIPVAEKHNTFFGKVEERIARGVATDQEIYIWAFKVHVGFIFRNSTLKIDIKAPASPNFWDLKGFGQEIWLFRKLYDVYYNQGVISPNPFGTVIRAKALTPSESFDFVHNMASGTMLFQLGSELIFVVLYDEGRTALSNVVSLLEYHRSYIAQCPIQERQDKAYIAQRVWACEAAYFLLRSLKGLSFVSSPTSFTAVPAVSRPATRPSDELELSDFCRSFGLKLEKFGGEVGHVFSNLTAEDIRAFMDAN